MGESDGPRSVRPQRLTLTPTEHHLRVLEPAPGVVAFYDGRVDGYRYDERENWVDDGALELGIASYAVVDGLEALVYDTSLSVEHAAFIRAELERRGVERFTVVLSHWHLDHVAGTEAFADSPIVANERTAELLSTNREAIETGQLEGPPAIVPLILPTTTFAGRKRLTIGEIEVELIQANIHSDDGTVLWLPAQRLLLCGDTMEDTVTYVDVPQDFDAHLRDLARLRDFHPACILPNHGDPELIASGGFPPQLNDATQIYIRALQRMVDEPALREMPLSELIAEPLANRWVILYPPYEELHRQNVETVLKASGGLPATSSES